MYYQLVKTEASFWYTLSFAFQELLKGWHFMLATSLQTRSVTNEGTSVFYSKFIYKDYFLHAYIWFMYPFDPMITKDEILQTTDTLQILVVCQQPSVSACVHLPNVVETWSSSAVRVTIFNINKVHAHWFQFLCFSLFSKVIAAWDWKLIYQNSQKDPTAFFSVLPILG